MAAKRDMLIIKNYFNQDISSDNAPNLSEKNAECKICLSFQHKYYCKDCISRKFFSTPNYYKDMYIDKENRVNILLKQKARKKVKCQKLIEIQNKREKLQLKNEHYMDRISIMKNVIQDKTQNLIESEKALARLKEDNQRIALKLPIYKERCDNLKKIVESSRGKNVEKGKKLTKIKETLKRLVQSHISELVTYIFPVEEVQPVQKGLEDSTESAIADALKSSFVRGTWVLMDTSGELKYRIVEPTLPGSGDYSAYLAKSDNNDVPTTERIGSNEAYNISAGLSYLTQLVNLLASYLNVTLPKKVSFSDFCLRDLTDREFHNKISKLNINVLYLCLSQGMDSIYLNPKQTLSNILHLVKHPGLGRLGPFEIDSGLVLGLEFGEEGRMEELSDSGEDGEGEGLEWEAVPLVAWPESTAGSVIHQSQGASGSIAGGLVTSLASIFKGWGYNK